MSHPIFEDEYRYRASMPDQGDGSGEEGTDPKEEETPTPAGDDT